MLAGSVPPLHVVIDPTTNHSGGEDANGNAGAVGGSYPAYVYDAENRITGSLTSAALYGNYYNNYAYDAQNKRVWKNLPIYNQSWQSLQDVETYYFYGTDGKLMAQFTPNYSPRQVGLAASFGLISGTTRTYFGSRLLGNEDRLGSRGKYYPYGEERSAQNPANDNVKFATYTRDAATGLDYADQRYYASGGGRFLTPDPYRATSSSANDIEEPQSWNKYAYAVGDPIGGFDPSGLLKCDPDIGQCYTEPGPDPSTPPGQPPPQVPPPTPPPAVPPGQPGPGPYSTPTWMGFNKGDGATVRSAENRARSFVDHSAKCDHALEKYGVKSLSDALDKLNNSGDHQNIWNGRNSQYMLQNAVYNKKTFTGPVSAFFTQ